MKQKFLLLIFMLGLFSNSDMKSGIKIDCAKLTCGAALLLMSYIDYRNSEDKEKTREEYKVGRINGFLMGAGMTLLLHSVIDLGVYYKNKSH